MRGTVAISTRRRVAPAVFRAYVCTDDEQWVPESTRSGLGSSPRGEHSRAEDPAHRVLQGPEKRGSRMSRAAERRGSLAVAAAVIRDPVTGRFLVAQRGTPGAGAGKWEFPGGKLKEDESPERCIRREIAEELGVEVEWLRYLGRVDHVYDDRGPIRLHFFEAGVRGTPRPLEHEALAWVSAEGLREYDLSDADRKFLTTCAPWLTRAEE